MPLSPLINGWEATRDGLHRAAQVLSAIRQTHITPQPNWIHVALYGYERGLTTGRLDNDMEVMLDFTDGSLRYILADGATGDKGLQDQINTWQTEGGAVGVETRAIPITGHTSPSLLNALTDALHIEPTDAMNAALDFQPDQPIQLDMHTSADYATALYMIYTGFSRFRSRLFGTMTPFVVWAHGFDLSMLWFHGHNPDESSESHINVGFSPGSSGFDRPYLYAYAYPMPADFQTRTLPAPARWYHDKWQGAVVDYNALIGDAHPDQLIEGLARGMFEALL
jgi:hypothetical protein